MIEDIIVDQEIKYFKNRNIYSLGQTNQKLSFIVKQAIEHNFTPIVIGGDHSLAIGSVDGTAAALSKHSSEIGTNLISKLILIDHIFKLIFSKLIKKV